MISSYEREQIEERERQTLAVWALLTIIVCVSFGVGMLWGMSVGYRDAVAVAATECRR